MKPARRIVCLLLVICLMLGVMLTSGGTPRVYADGEEAPALPLKIDFEDETVNERPSGWADHPDVVKEAPDTSKGITVIDEGGNKCLEVVSSPMPQALNYLAHYEFQPTDSILLKYRFKLTGRSNGAYLIYPVYTGMNAKSDYQCSPLHPFVVTHDNETYTMYFGYSDWKSTQVKDGLVADQWYEMVMLVDLKTDTRKMYLDGELLDLSNPQSADIYEDKSQMTMNRLSVGTYYEVSASFLVDDIEVLASAKATEVVLEQTDYAIRVNQSIALNPDFRPLGAEPCELTFTSADPSIATVDENGLITGVKEGKTTISVKTETEGVAPAILNVAVDKEMIGTFTNVPDKLDIPLQGHMVLSPQLTLDYAGDSTIEWVSSNPEVATIDEWGEVYAAAEGQTTLIVRVKAYPTVMKQIPVTVKKADVQQTIYVAPDGTGDGSSESTPASLDNALTILEGIDSSTMTGNVEVVLADGYYYRTEALALNEKHGGNNLYSVVFKAAEGAAPTIGGALHIAGSDFTESDIPGVYVADMPAGTVTRQLYVDNVRATRAKQDGLLKNAEFLKDEEGKSIGIVCENTELLECTDPDGLEIVYYRHWQHQRTGVKEIKAGADGKVQLIMDEPSWTYSTTVGYHFDLDLEMVTHIENALIYLDEPGEWYLDETAGKLYYMPREFEDLSKVTVTIPALDVWDQSRETGGTPDAKKGLVTVFGSDLDNIAQNIHFEGITFADVTWMRPSFGYGHTASEGNYIRDDGYGETDRVADGAIAVRRANGISFYGCTFTRIGTTGIWMTEGTKNSMMVGNHFFDVDGTTIQIGEPDYTRDVQNYNPSDVRRVIKNNDVLNNYIHDIGIDYHSAAAVSVGFAADIDISCNDIFNIPYSGLNIGRGWGNNANTPRILRNMTVSYNFIHELMYSNVSDGGAFYTNGVSSGNNKVINNYFRNKGGDGAPIYFDQGACLWDAVNNVVDVSATTTDPYSGKCIDWATTAASCNSITVRDNYFWDNDEQYFGFLGSKIVTENNTRVFNGEWPEEALKIIEEAGLKEAYTGLKNNQIERLYTNLSMYMVTPRVTNYRKLKLDTDNPEKKTYQVEVTATDGKDQALDITGCVKYYIEDESVAYVDENGLVTALKAGETILRVYVNSNNILTTMESKVVVTGETVETRPTEATEPTGSVMEDPTPQNPVMWIVIGILTVAVVAVVVILLPKKKADK